jgi:hypothetical protein
LRVADNTGVLPWWGERWHQAAFVFFVVSWGLCVAVYLRDAFAPDWMISLVLGSGLLTSLVTLGRQLPLQNVVVVGIVFGSAGAVWAWFVGTSLDWSDGLNWRTTVFWTIVLLNARAIGQFLLRSRRGRSFYGLELMGVTGSVFALCQAALYKDEIHFLVAPLAVAGLLFITLPLMLGKRPDDPPVSWQPIVVLMLSLAWGLLPRL